MVMKRVPAELVVRGLPVIAFADGSTVKVMEASAGEERILSTSDALALFPVLYARMENCAGTLMFRFFSKVWKLASSNGFLSFKVEEVMFACKDIAAYHISVSTYAQVIK